MNRQQYSEFYELHEKYFDRRQEVIDWAFPLIRVLENDPDLALSNAGFAKSGITVNLLNRGPGGKRYYLDTLLHEDDESRRQKRNEIIRLQERIDLLKKELAQ